MAEKTETDLDDQLLPIVRTGIRVMVWSLGVIIGLNNAGYDVGAVLAGFGIGGLAFALAAQDTVANIFGGITIFVQKPFKTGDLISIEEHKMIVVEIGLRTTTLNDYYYNHVIMIPNGKFISSKITNISRYPGYVRYEDLYLSPISTADQVDLAIKLISDILHNHPELDFGDRIRINDLEKSPCLHFYYSIHKFSERYRVRTEVGLAIMRAFEQHNLKLALPTQYRVVDSFESGIYG